MKKNIWEIIIIILGLFIWGLCIFEFGQDLVFLTNAKKVSGTITEIKYENHKETCDYTMYPTGCNDWTNAKYVMVKYNVNNIEYNNKLLVNSDMDIFMDNLEADKGQRIEFYYNNFNKNDIVISKDSLYMGSIVTILIFILPIGIFILLKIKKERLLKGNKYEKR